MLWLDGVYVDTRNLPRSWDLNACPARIGPADTVNLAPVNGVYACDALRPRRDRRHRRGCRGR